MELNIPMSIHCDGAGEAVFNAPITRVSSVAGLGDVLSVPSGAYYHIDFVGGNDGAPIRNPVTNRPHTHGAIPHMFKRSGTIITLTGRFIANSPADRRVLRDNLKTVLNASYDAVWPSANRFRFLWTPPGVSTRMREGRLYEKLKVTGSDADPHTFEFAMYFEKPEAHGYTEHVSGAGAIPNAGNKESFPYVKVFAGGPFTLSNGTYQVKWGKSFLGDSAPILGSYILVDMFYQTMYWDTTGANALARLFMEDSDFWTIPRGGCTVSCDASIEIHSRDGWVG